MHSSQRQLVVILHMLILLLYVILPHYNPKNTKEDSCKAFITRSFPGPQLGHNLLRFFFCHILCQCMVHIISSVITLIKLDVIKLRKLLHRSGAWALNPYLPRNLVGFMRNIDQQGQSEIILPTDSLLNDV